MYIISDHAIDYLVYKLKQEGWSGNTARLEELMDMANNEAKNSVSNTIEQITNDYSRCLNFVYMSSCPVDGICELHLFDNSLIFKSIEGNFGPSIENNFNRALYMVKKSFPEMDLSKMKFYHITSYGKQHVEIEIEEDGEIRNWAYDNIDVDIKHLLTEIEHHRNK